MRKLLMLLVLLGMPAVAAAETWENVPLVDHMCVDRVKANPDAHKTSCLLKCANSGYGILTGGNWLKLDDAGNEKALAALKKTSKKDHVRVNVTGEKKGDLISVSSLAIPD